MELKLYYNTPVKEIKKQFSRFFPFLKIEFFKGGHKEGKSSFPDQRVHDGHYLSEVTGVLKEGVFIFQPSTTVAEFEQKLQNEHGLPVQVFRKAEDVWIETIQTDNMTLEHQNKLGAESVRSQPFNIHTLFL